MSEEIINGFGTNAVDFGKCESVTLRPSDIGLEFVINFIDKRSVKISMDYGRVCDLSKRLDTFTGDAALMMVIGLNPYNSEHRESFELAKLLEASNGTN